MRKMGERKGKEQVSSTVFRILPSLFTCIFQYYCTFPHIAHLFPVTFCLFFVLLLSWESGSTCQAGDFSLFLLPLREETHRLYRTCYLMFSRLLAHRNEALSVFYRQLNPGRARGESSCFTEFQKGEICYLPVS